MHTAVLRLIPFFAVAVWLSHLDRPLLDGMAVKQFFVAHKARAIGGPPFDLTCNRFAFLEANGERLQLTEEVPFYTGLLAVAFRLFGEHDWLGRLLSIAFSIVALVAFHDLVRRTIDRTTARAATALFAICPLWLFYGRAVQPDSAMLALMLLTACCYDRRLERGGRLWLVFACAAGMLAVLAKYYGLMVLIPLAHMSTRRRGWRGLFAPDLLAITAAMATPLALWFTAVFATSHNPANDKVYFLFQMPELLWQRTLYLRFFDRFLWKDCGPLTLVLLVIAGASAITRWIWPRAFDGWAVMGIVFFFALGPLLRCHDYYELMLLPATAVWAASGWQALTARLGEQSKMLSWAGAVILIAGLVIQSPLIMSGRYECDCGYLALAQRLDQLCSVSDRVAVFGPDAIAATVHYAHRDGYAFHEPPVDGPGQLDLLQARGVEIAAVYLSPWLKPTDRELLESLIASRRVIDHRAGPWAAGREGEYYILDLTCCPDFQVLDFTQRR